MKQLIESPAWDVAGFFGLLAGMAGLVACLLVDEVRVLAWPALALVIGALLHGLR